MHDSLRPTVVGVLLCWCWCWCLHWPLAVQKVAVQTGLELGAAFARNAKMRGRMKIMLGVGLFIVAGWLMEFE
ncbi:hypothetical protein F4778DRAFT_728307 [Xylariomycetidae sp. FL2044]|nr:hypothetical protein F4778DRAFT_728307 [Xylariomycetidae sp. FL2044]